MVYRDIIEYAREHLDSDCQSKEEARLAIRIHLKSIQDKGGETPLHSRGTKRRGYYRDLWTPPAIIGIDGEAWSAAFKAVKKDRAGLFRKAIRKAAITRKLEAKALMAVEDFGLIDLPAADAMADAMLEECTKEIEGVVKRHYPWDGNNYGVRVNAYCNMDDPHTVRAAYERGVVSVTVTARSLMSDWMPMHRIYDDHRKAIVLDAVVVKGTLIYAQWAVQAKRTRQLVVMKGAFCDEEFVPGYDTEAEVLENEESIRTRARVQSVTRGLIGDSEKPRPRITTR